MVSISIPQQSLPTALLVFERKCYRKLLKSQVDQKIAKKELYEKIDKYCTVIVTYMYCKL